MAESGEAAALAALLATREVLVLDGGLATELEKRGHDLEDPLWSARLVRDAPGAIRDVHRAYLEAGADCLVTSSYQATVQGFRRAGAGKAEAGALLRRTLELAREARFEVARSEAHGAARRPAIAASIGPYGAFLADGSEYDGRYGVDRDALRAFHEPRWEILAGETDLFACETLPSALEAEVLVDLLRQTPHVAAWLSFSCRDGESLHDGTPVEECAALAASVPNVVAVGVNCTPPRFVASLIDRLRRGAPDLPIAAYPNSGERYDPVGRCWHGTSDPMSFSDGAIEWRRRGARLLGGCCRTGPDHVAALRAAFPR